MGPQPHPQPFDLYPRPVRSAPPAAAHRVDQLGRIAAAHGWTAHTNTTQPDPDQPPSRVEFTANHPGVSGIVLIRWDIDTNGYRMTVCRAPLGR